MKTVLKTKFVHTVSKGSRYNQIYVPKGMENEFEAGDLVEVRLLQKSTQLYYSKGLPKLSPFKEKLIREMFSFLSGFEGMRQAFVVGSFLTQKIEYNDIDLLLVLDKRDEALEEKIYEKLIDRFNLRFHVISIVEERLHYLAESCPLTRSMLYYHVSNKAFRLEAKRRIDKKHLRFLLMMPEDVLEIRVGSRAFYDNVRRLTAIERFLEGKEEDPLKVNEGMKKALGERLFSSLKENEEIDERDIEKVRLLIKSKLDEIKRKLKKE